MEYNKNRNIYDNKNNQKNNNKKEINQKLKDKSLNKSIIYKLRKDNFIQNNSINKYFHILLFFIIIFFISLTNESKVMKLRQLILSSQISLTLIGNGNQKILSDFFNNIPDQILINGESTTVGKSVDLTEETNVITMIWENDLDNCSGIFRELPNIKNVSFVSFDPSKVIDMSYMFFQCYSLESIDINEFNTKSLIYMGYMFFGCKNLLSLDLNKFNTTLVTHMDRMFYDCLALNSLNINNINTISIKDLSYMFYNCISLISLNLNNFQTPNLQYTGHMFDNCINLKSLELNNFDTSNLIYSDHMFCRCRALTSLNLDSFDASSISGMDEMFLECSSLKSLNLSNFNTKNAHSMASIFNRCSSLEYLNIQNFNTSLVNSFDKMFYGCSKLTSLDLSNFNTKNIYTMGNMFSGCSSLEFLDISNFNTPSLNYMDYMFNGCEKLTTLNLSNFNTINVLNMNNMFQNCKSLKSLDLNNFETSKVNSMGNMFYGCSSLEFLDISNFNTPTVSYMDYMFYGCEKLTSLNLSNFNTINVIKMSYMFQNCKSLKSLDLNNFDTPKVVSMGYMFYGCESLENLNINNFNTSLVEYLDHMFYGCKQLTSLNLSSFDTSFAKDISNMFYDCNSLKSLNLNNFNTKTISSLENMFYNCNSLLSLEMNNFDTSKVNNMYRMFYGCSQLISLNLSNFNITSNTLRDEMFSNCNNNLIYCINEQEILNLLSDQLSTFRNNCTYICVENLNKKFVIEENKCIDNCNSDDNYKFEYNNICYSTCPNGTHNSSIYNYLCEEGIEADNIDTSENTVGESLVDEIICDIKCNKCSLESKNDGLCISCNYNGKYYPKLNDILNKNGFINCYNIEPEGYYLDNNELIYKPCFSECKNCIIFEEENRNKCNTCNSNYKFNFLFCFEICKYNNDKCYIKDKKYINIDFPIVDKESKKTIYSYETNSNLKELKDKYNNLTFIDISLETKNFLIEQFNLEQTNKIFVLIINSPNMDSKFVTYDYDYKYFLENGTELNLNKITEDFYTNIYVPIENLDLANFNYSKYFAEQGYDIYDKNSDFYNDVCSPANLGENDIILEDRKKDIYPNNITLCKDNCYYNGINIEEKRIICTCNLNVNNNSSDNKEDDDFLKEDDNNFFSYLLDNINYKIFECYNIILIFSNLKNNYAFYTIQGVFFVIIVINIIYCVFTMNNIKKFMIEEMPTQAKIKMETKKELERYKIKIICNPKKKKKKKNKNKKKNNKLNKNKSIKSATRILKESQTKSPVYESLIPNISEENNIEIKKDNKNGDINELPYKKAIIEDKRNIFQIFYSLIIKKLEIINFFCGNEKFKIILICEYILSLLINFFFNTLLYSDEVISNKYHNNGELDLIVTLTLSLLSNIITSIICYYIKYSRGLEDRLEEIMELKNKEYYIINIHKFFKYLKLKFLCFLLGEIIIIACCFYYIVIFCTVYSFSKISLLINYLTSLVEGLIISVAITIIVLVTRILGLKCLNNKFYNASKYINERF